MSPLQFEVSGDASVYSVERSVLMPFFACSACQIKSGKENTKVHFCIMILFNYYYYFYSTAEGHWQSRGKNKKSGDVLHKHC